MKKLSSIVAAVLVLTSFSAMAFAQTPPKQSTVYVVEAGKSYHKKNCRLKKGSKGMLLAEAKRKGFKPCKVCKPS